MTPERWQLVNQILVQAWEHDASERAAFLDQTCGDDPELRSQLETLLASDESVDEFLASPAIEVAAASAAGGSLTTPAIEIDTDEWTGIGRYRILREIGRGGMGTVYMGERSDGHYQKLVAIKVISSHLVGEETLRRFCNERQVAAGLEHPNIARLLDGGATSDGLPYMVLEYVEGVRIDAWCDNHKLPLRDRLKLFREVCAGVQYAHDRDVIHRDIKPANILVTSDGTPKLLDFGIAKVLNPELSNSPEITLGVAPMTPEYASPEQVRREPVGPGSDIYALGVVLYRLLSGHVPYSFQGHDLAQWASVICEHEPEKPSAAILREGSGAIAEMRGESPAGLRRQLAGELDKIVLKALRKETDRRYASVAQFSRDIARFLEGLPVQAHRESLVYRGRKFLKRNRVPVMTAAIAAVLVLALVAGLGRLTKLYEGTEPGVRSVAVLPLENLAGDPEQEYFTDGFTDALIGELARIRGLRVISSTSVMSFKGVRRRLPDIARSLAVKTIAEGSVLRSGTRVRISMRLVDASKDHPIWSGTYEGELRDVLALQDRVAGDIAREIDVTLTVPEAARAAHNRRVDIGAYDAYLKGRHQYSADFTQESTQKAMAWFQQALVLDPRYAPAYAGLADCYFGLSNLYYPPVEVMPKAKRAAEKALELDDTLAEAHAALGLIESVFEFNRVDAGREFKHAIELRPSDAETHLWYAQHLAGMGKLDDAVAEAEQAEKLDPISAGLNGYVGYALYMACKYDQAIQRLQSVVDAHPDYHQPHAFLALAYEQKGDWPKAIAEMEKAYELDKEPEALAQLGHIYAVAGRKADALNVLGQLTELSRRRYVSAYDIAVLHAGLGEPDQAFQWLQKVDEDRSEWFAAVNVDPRLYALHSDPRFADILRKVGLLK
jgi:serine/threonine protein kinase/TolB-like protein/Flp pilus assembly protein TadD